MPEMPTAVLIDTVRTPSGRGRPGGALAHRHPVDLFATVIAALVERTGIDPATIDDVMGGCLSQAGRQATNVTRSAALAAGLPESVPAVTIDRQCGSSQQAVAFAVQAVMSGQADAVIAGGVEMMSSNPIGFAELGEDRVGERLAARYPDGFVGQGVSAELIAARRGFGRDELDAFAAESHRRAAAAESAGAFDGERIEVDGVRADETVRPATTVEALAALSPAFRSDEMARRFPEIGWVVTAGSSSPYTDGASAVLVMSETAALSAGLTPRARFHAAAVVGSDPIEMLTGILPATRRILERTGLGVDDMDVIEVNEAFAPVPLAWIHEFGADPLRVNPLGGAIALGHALGSSGTRLLGTLLTALERDGGRWGLQVMCEGAGMANAILIERI